MEVRRKISASTLHSVIGGLFFCTLFSLPWNSQFPVFTYLLILLGGVLVLTGLVKISYSSYLRQLLFSAFTAYFLLVLSSVFRYTGLADHSNLEQKTSLIAIPVALYVILTNYSDLWDTGIKGFLAGNIVASVQCFSVASVKYLHTHDSSVFFYHGYASTIGQSAIYFSFYLLIALGYIVLNRQVSHHAIAWLTGSFLYLNLLLLSSKIVIITGSILLLILLLRSVRNNLFKAALLLAAGALYLILFFTANPIKKRFSDINAENYSAVFHMHDLTNYHFDGLSLRSMLWRMGYELINEKKAWFTGDGGKNYQEDLNKKMATYHIYTGDGKHDTGYLNYNMHDQYMETYVQYGLVGLSLLLFILGIVLYTAVCYGQVMLTYTTILFSIAFLTEAVLETQSGIILFTIILSGEWILLQRKRSGITI